MIQEGIYPRGEDSVTSELAMFVASLTLSGVLPAATASLLGQPSGVAALLLALIPPTTSLGLPIALSLTTLLLAALLLPPIAGELSLLVSLLALGGVLSAATPTLVLSALSSALSASALVLILTWPKLGVPLLRVHVSVPHESRRWLGSILPASMTTSTGFA